MRFSRIGFGWKCVLSVASIFLAVGLLQAADNQSNVADTSHDTSGSLVVVVMDPFDAAAIVPLREGVCPTQLRQARRKAAEGTGPTCARSLQRIAEKSIKRRRPR